MMQHLWLEWSSRLKPGTH